MGKSCSALPRESPGLDRSKSDVIYGLPQTQEPMSDYFEKLAAELRGCTLEERRKRLAAMGLRERNALLQHLLRESGDPAKLRGV
jgi:hypothetical protein